MSRKNRPHLPSRGQPVAGQHASIPKDAVASNRERLVQTVMESSASSFPGPLPPPDLLRQYNDVVPGSAERILALAERQASMAIE